MALGATGPLYMCRWATGLKRSGRRLGCGQARATEMGGWGRRDSGGRRGHHGWAPLDRLEAVLVGQVGELGQARGDRRETCVDNRYAKSKNAPGATVGDGGTRRAVSASRPNFRYCWKFGLAVLMS